MKINQDACDLSRLELLAEDRLPADELSSIELHLETCAHCREALDQLVNSDECLTAARRSLDDDATGFFVADREPPYPDSLDFLAPSDWPDSIGRLGAYEVKGVLGRGGMGIVLKAFDPALNRNVAIKVLSSPLATCGASRRRFLREARAAAAVVHEHVVSVFGVEPAGLPYLVMEYVPGRSLQERLDRYGPLNLPEILRIGHQTAAGLAAAHAQGLVHRDVKPANILLENGVERVRLTDFGLARAVSDAGLTRSGVVAGTPHYMAPEQANGEAVDHRADLFSLGSTLYAISAGHPPFRAETPLGVLRRVCDDNPRPLREINPEIPEWLDTIVGRLLAKSPARRFQTASEVADLLARSLAHVQQPLSAPLPPELAATTARWRPRKRSLVQTGLLVAAMAGSTAVSLALVGPWQTARQPRQASEDGPQPFNPLPVVESNEKRPDLAGIEEIPNKIRDASQFARQIDAILHTPGESRFPDTISESIQDLNREIDQLESQLVPRPQHSFRMSSPAVFPQPKADPKKGPK